MFSLLAAVLCLSLVVRVRGHGYVHTLNVGGKDYSGYLPFQDPYEAGVKRIVRVVPDDGPVTNVKDASLACNVGGDKPAALVAEAAAGSKVTFKWNNWPADHLGPVSTYMASCKGDCLKFDASGAKWFKIDAAGYDSSKKQWASAKLIADGASWTSTIPSTLASGNYLIRHEIVALHSVGQPQFYPMCAQVKVTGSGNQTPSGSELVSIPGIYDNAKWPDIWSDGFKSFTIPGPALFSGNGNNDAQPAPASTTPSTPSSTHSSTTSGSVTSAAPAGTSVASSAASAGSSASSSQVSAPSSTGKCRSKVARRSRLSRHASLAKRQH